MLGECAIHLVLLDVMMSGESGLDLCRDLAARGTVPVILLTARVTEEDRIEGLELDADDYICKPFNPRELLARIRALLSRAPPRKPDLSTRPRRFAQLIHDAQSEALILPDQTRVALTSTENLALNAFLDHPGQTLTRVQLLDLIRGRDPHAYDRTVDNVVSRLRRKLGDQGRQARIIVTEWGGGYRLAVPVEPV